MYDLHCHLLPGVDDGPQSWDEAIALARAMAADGVRVAAATPHGFGSGQCLAHEPAQLRASASELRQRLAQAGIQLELVLGSELYLLPDLAGRVRRGQALSYEGSRTVLLEVPQDRLSRTLDQVIFELQVAGYRVLLAHPERSPQVQDDPNRLIPLIEKGVYMQLTAASLTGLHGSRLRRIAEVLLDCGMCHVLASDAHAAQGIRAPALQAAYAIACQRVGQQTADALVRHTPAGLLQDRAPAPSAPQPYRPRRRWFFWAG